MRRISIIGPGRMGGALALALARAGFEITEIFGRTLGRAKSLSEMVPGSRALDLETETAAKADIFMITTGDPGISGASDWLARRLKGGEVVLHTSGSISSEILAACAAAGGHVGSMHPLVSVSDRETGSRSFAGAYFCIEGTGPAVEAAESLVNALGGNAFAIRTEFKPLYHAAAVMSAGHIAALFSMAVEMLTHCGLGEAESRAVLLPLMASTLRNLEAKPPADAVTGSFARLDIAAFERHLASFQDRIPPDIQSVFLELGRRSVELARDRGGDRDRADELATRIDIAKSRLGC